MNIRYFLILIVTVSLSLSGCAYKRLDPGYSLKVQVVSQDGLPAFTIECAPRAASRELTFADIFLSTLLATFSDGSDKDPSSQSPSMAAVSPIMGVLIAASTATRVEANKMLEKNEELHKDLSKALADGSIACPPKPTTGTGT